jgi:hypothetical protein
MVSALRSPHSSGVSGSRVLFELAIKGIALELLMSKSCRLIPRTRSRCGYPWLVMKRKLFFSPRTNIAPCRTLCDFVRKKKHL